MRALFITALYLLVAPASATTLTVALEDANNSPYEYLDTDARLTGFHVEVIRAVGQRLGWNIEFKRLPWKRAVQALHKGEVQAISYIAPSPDRENFALFLPGNLLHVSRTAMFIKRTRAEEIRYAPPFETMAKRWRVAVPDGYLMSNELMDLAAKGIPIEKPSVNQLHLFMMLSIDRFDIVCGASDALNILDAEAPALAEHIQLLEGSIRPGTPMYLAFSRKAPAHLAMQFETSYRQFRQGPDYLVLAERFKVREQLPEPHDFE